MPSNFFVAYNEQMLRSSLIKTYGNAREATGKTGSKNLGNDNRVRLFPPRTNALLFTMLRMGNSDLVVTCLINLHLTGISLNLHPAISPGIVIIRKKDKVLTFRRVVNTYEILL